MYHREKQAEKMLANKETDKSIASMIRKDIRDEKAVKNATVDFTTENSV